MALGVPILKHFRVFKALGSINMLTDGCVIFWKGGSFKRSQNVFVEK